MNDDKLLTLQLTLNQINIVLSGLGKLSLESALQTFEIIHKQVNEQMQKEESQDITPKDKNIK